MTADIMVQGWFSVTNDQFFEGAEAVNINIAGVGGSGGVGVTGVGAQSTHQHILLDNESATSLSIQETPIPEANVTHNVRGHPNLEVHGRERRQRAARSLRARALRGHGHFGDAQPHWWHSDSASPQSASSLGHRGDPESSGNFPTGRGNAVGVRPQCGLDHQFLDLDHDH